MHQKLALFLLAERKHLLGILHELHKHPPLSDMDSDTPLSQRWPHYLRALSDMMQYSQLNQLLQAFHFLIHRNQTKSQYFHHSLYEVHLLSPSLSTSDTSHVANSVFWHAFSEGQICRSNCRSRNSNTCRGFRVRFPVQLTGNQTTVQNTCIENTGDSFKAHLQTCVTYCVTHGQISSLNPPPFVLVFLTVKSLKYFTQSFHPYWILFIESVLNLEATLKPSHSGAGFLVHSCVSCSLQNRKGIEQNGRNPQLSGSGPALGSSLGSGDRHPAYF